MRKKRKATLPVCCVLLTGCLLFIHRRVIRAWIKGEPMPEAPAWHFWCRRSDA